MKSLIIHIQKRPGFYQHKDTYQSAQTEKHYGKDI